MSFSQEWESVYTAQKQLSIWPWSDLVSYVMRYSRPTQKGMRVLEIGCGAGANIPFFVKLQADYYAVDGSSAIVKVLQDSFPLLASNICVCDFTQNIPFQGPFSLVVDRAALTHNSTASICRCLDLLRSKMPSGSRYIGIDWFSTLHSDFCKGEEDGDRNTRNKIVQGQFAHIGRVHFSDATHLRALFDGFEIIQMEEKIVRRIVPDDDHVFASWNFCAVRK
jgi:SAM-dependent methyltransferase